MRKMSGKRRKRRRHPVARSNAYQQGFHTGYHEAFTQGVGDGHTAYKQTQDLTSIVIPTCNERDVLIQCIESIRANTPEPHEIIVVDNGSTDGTADYLRSQVGRLRYHIEPHQLGFARAVNIGLRMCSGSTVMFLNHDTVLTPRWLGNLLACLYADPERRLVGPVTNYISGVQCIDTSYDSLEAMQQFAASYNQSDPTKWEKTERLTGFCVLMTRETMQRIGYMDERYKIGNCEDDDYGLRARIAGMELWIARDTFIHHIGSVSMNRLGTEGVRKVTERNVALFNEKWGDASVVLDSARRIAREQVLPSSRFYPTHVLVRASGNRVYWIEEGRRYSVNMPAYTELPRLSLPALRHFTHGGELSWKEVDAKLHALRHAFLAGSFISDCDGTMYQYDGQCLRRFASPELIHDWHLQDRKVHPLHTLNLESLSQGLPIIASEVLHTEPL